MNNARDKEEKMVCMIATEKDVEPEKRRVYAPKPYSVLPLRFNA